MWWCTPLAPVPGRVVSTQASLGPVLHMPVILALGKVSLQLGTLQRSCLKADNKQNPAVVRPSFMPYSWIGAKLLFIICWAPGQEETSFSVYNDVIRGHALATFGLLLLICNFERPGLACPSLPTLPVRRHDPSWMQNNKASVRLF